MIISKRISLTVLVVLLSETNTLHTSDFLSEIFTKRYARFSDHEFLSEGVEKCIFEPPQIGFTEVVWNHRCNS